MEGPSLAGAAQAPRPIGFNLWKEGKGREGKGREGKVREGKGREGKGGRKECTPHGKPEKLQLEVASRCCLISLKSRF